MVTNGQISPPRGLELPWFLLGTAICLPWDVRVYWAGIGGVELVCMLWVVQEAANHTSAKVEKGLPWRLRKVADIITVKHMVKARVHVPFPLHTCRWNWVRAFEAFSFTLGHEYLFMNRIIEDVYKTKCIGLGSNKLLRQIWVRKQWLDTPRAAPNGLSMYEVRSGSKIKIFPCKIRWSCVGWSQSGDLANGTINVLHFNSIHVQ